MHAILFIHTANTHAYTVHSASTVQLLSCDSAVNMEFDTVPTLESQGACCSCTKGTTLAKAGSLEVQRSHVLSKLFRRF